MRRLIRVQQYATDSDTVAGLLARGEWAVHATEKQLKHSALQLPADASP